MIQGFDAEKYAEMKCRSYPSRRESQDLCKLVEWDDWRIVQGEVLYTWSGICKLDHVQWMRVGKMYRIERGTRARSPLLRNQVQTGKL